MARPTTRDAQPGFEIPSGRLYRIACSECGVVHDIVLVSHDNQPIGVAVQRNGRATGRRRRSNSRLEQ